MAHSKEVISLKDISNVFSIFHDGGPEEWKIHNGNLSIKMYCQYLAELISPEFEFFTIELIGVKTLDYKPWEPFKIDHPELSLIDKLNKCEFEIATAELENGEVSVACHEHNSFFGTPGGQIILVADGIKINAQDGKDISIKQLTAICKSYWDNFGKK
ncbi:MAG: hypothetical protein H6582_01145 [Crocinitomicaceae bacterium]|nr:hypothetical protein [Crocinitomicaceae bacterium]